MPTLPGGFGESGFGLGAFGAGGPLSVVRALAVAGQVLRVVFNEEPEHRSPAGTSDALNPSNYVLDCPSGAATSPRPTGVDRKPIVGPAWGVGDSDPLERGIDVHVDRQLVAGVVYRVRVRNVRAMAGGALGTPDEAEFGGVTKIEEVKLPDRNQDLIDFSTPPALGCYYIDDSGDIAITTPDQSTRQRVYRRQFTKRNSFRFLPGYGAGPEHKGPAGPATMAAWRADMLRQIRSEPDVAQIAIQMSINGLGLATVASKIRTRRGAFVSINAEVSAIGDVRTT